MKMPADDFSQTAILTFSLGSQLYALPIEDVIEVAAMVERVILPDAAPEILGVVNRRGAVLPLLDLRRVFRQEAAPVSSSTLFIVAAHQARLAGLVVDEVRQVEYVAPAQNAPTAGKYIRGIISHKQQLIQVISLPSILAAFLDHEAAFEGNQ